MTLAGNGLHSGAHAELRFFAHDGPVAFRSAGRTFALDELVVEETLRSTTLRSRDASFRLGTVEHLCAAIGGLGVTRGLLVEVVGPEVPLLDGGAALFCDAVEALGLPCELPAQCIERAETWEIAASRYDVAPGDGVRVDVRLVYDDARLVSGASWSGDPGDFRRRIAPARTFALGSEVLFFVERGLARHVDRESVVVITEGGVLSAGAPFAWDEPARHKLLDVIGDLVAHRALARGVVRAVRPGHTATHRFIEQWRGREGGWVARGD